MDRRPPRRVGVLALIGLLAASPDAAVVVAEEPAATAPAPPPRFEPERHLPADLVFVARIASVERLLSGFRRSTLGRIVLHPAWREALAGASDRLRVPFAVIEQRVLALTGKRPRDLSALLAGEIVLAVTGAGAGGRPEALAAIELGEDREGLLSTVDHAARVLAAATEEADDSGTESRTETRTGHGVSAVQTPAGKLVYGVLGTHLVLTSTHDLFARVAVAYDGKTEGLELFPASRLRRALDEVRSESDVQLEVAVDVTRLRSLALGAMADNETLATVRTVLEISGLDRVAAASLRAAIPDGELELRARVAFDDTPRGLLALAAELLPPLELEDDVLGLLPPGASELSAVHVAPGRLVAGLLALARRHVPEAATEFDLWLRSVEDSSGISVERDVATLPAITLVSARVAPAGGGLLQDQIVIARTEQVDPYRALLHKIAAVIEAPPRTVEIGPYTMRYVALARAGQGPGRLLERLAAGGAAALDAIPSTAWFSVVVPGVYWCDVPGGWTVLSPSSQALQRYLRYYAPWTSFTAGTSFARRFREHSEGTNAVTVFEGDEQLVALYNTLLAIAGAFAPTLALAGIDLGPLPPGEEFHRDTTPGFIRLSADAGGFTLHARRPFASLSATACLLRGGAAATAIAVPLWLGMDSPPR